MASSPTDTLDRVSDSTTGRPVVSALAGPKALAAASISLTDATNWTTTTGTHFVIYEVDANGYKVSTTQTDWKGTLTGTTVSGLTLTGGTDRAYSAGAIVEIAPTSRWAKDLYDNVSTHANQDGSLKTTAVQAALNQGTTPADYTTLATVPTVSATNGNRSFDLTFTGVDYTDRLSKGMRLRIPRTGTAVQTQVTSLNGTNQYWNRTTTINGMTFTDDFVAGAWVKLSSYPSVVGEVISRWNGTSGWGLEINANGTVSIFGSNGASTNYSNATTYQSLPLNKWIHISAQLDMSAFTATSTTSYIMIDGVDVPITVARGGTNPTSLIQAGNLEVGSRNASLFFPGKIAQAFVSSAKITQANIRSFMNAPLTAALCTANNIISAYAFAGSGTDINTTNANDLTAQNSAVATNADSPFNANAYAIIMSDPVYSGGNTTLTVSTPEGYPIPNATLGTSSYSSVKVPYGFPATKDKWRLKTLFRTQATITSSATFGAIGSVSTNFPVGDYDIAYSVSAQKNPSASSGARIWTTLSTTTNSETDVELSAYAEASNVSSIAGLLSRTKGISLSTATTYNLLIRTDDASGNLLLRNEFSPASLTAENAFL